MQSAILPSLPLFLLVYLCSFFCVFIFLIFFGFSYFQEQILFGQLELEQLVEKQCECSTENLVSKVF